MELKVGCLENVVVICASAAPSSGYTEPLRLLPPPLACALR